MATSELNGTVLAAVIGVTVANVVVASVDTSSVEARMRFAFIDVFLLGWKGVSGLFEVLGKLESKNLRRSDAP